METQDNAPVETPVETSTPEVVETVVSEPPKKRGPGRPRKDGSSPPGVKAEKPGAAKESAAKPQRRGAKLSAEAVNDLAVQIEGLHVIAAMATGQPILKIDPKEALMLAKGISAVAEEYGLALDGKTGAAMQLFGAAAMVYGRRAWALLQARKAAQANIVDVHPQ